MVMFNGPCEMKIIQMELERARYGNGGLIQTHWSGSEFKPKRNNKRKC